MAYKPPCYAPDGQHQPDTRSQVVSVLVRLGPSRSHVGAVVSLSWPPTCPRTGPKDARSSTSAAEVRVKESLQISEEGGFEPPGTSKRPNGFRGLWRISVQVYLVCISTVLRGGNTALVVSCPSSAGEFATKMAPRSRASCSEAELPM